MTFFEGTLVLLEVMSLILITFSCVPGRHTGRKRGYLTFAAFSFLESLGLIFRLAGPLVRVEWFTETAIPGCHIAALMFLTAFAPVSRKWNPLWFVLLPLLLLIGYRTLLFLPFPISGYHIPDAVFTIVSTAFAVCAIWNCAMDTKEPGAVVPLKLATVFLFAAALSTAAETISSTVLDIRLTRSFAVLRILCCLALAECVISRIRDTDFLKTKGRPLLLCFPVASMILFLIPVCFVPILFQNFGIRIESQFALEKAQDAGDDLRELVRQHEDFLIRRSADPVLLDLLSNPDQTLLQSSRLTGMVLPGYSDQDSILYLLEAGGICLDCSSSDENLDFRGTDFSFRDYVQKASANRTSHELVVGKLTGRTALCSARPVFSNGKKIGYCVVRTALEPVFRGLRGEYFALTLPDGTVLQSTLPGGLPGRNFRLPFPEGQSYFADNDFLMARAPCGIPGSDWFAVSRVPVHLQSVMYGIGQFCVIALWIVVLSLFRIALVHIKMKDSLEKSMRWRLAVFHGNAAGILVVDENRNIVEVNDTLLRIFNCGESDFRQVGLSLIHQNNEADREFADRAYEAIEKTGKYETLLETFSPKGDELVLRISGHSMSMKPEANGLYSRATVWSLIDVTTGVQRAKTVEKYKEHYHRLLENTHSHIFICDPRGQILESNEPEISNFLRRNKSIFLPDYFEDSDAAFYLKVFSNVIASGRTVNYRRKISFKGVSSERLDTVYPIRENGIVTEIGVISRDAVRFGMLFRSKEGKTE